MIRSTPSSSGSGNMTPASTTIVVSPQLSAIMFMPNSPSPPSGTISSILNRGCTHLADDTPGGASSSKGTAKRGSIRLLGAPEINGRDGADVGRVLSDPPKVASDPPGLIRPRL